MKKAPGIAGGPVSDLAEGLVRRARTLRRSVLLRGLAATRRRRLARGGSRREADDPEIVGADLVAADAGDVDLPGAALAADRPDPGKLGRAGVVVAGGLAGGRHHREIAVEAERG